MAILIAQEGKTPSTDKLQDRIQAAAASDEQTIIAENDTPSFAETLAGLPVQDQTKETASQTHMFDTFGSNQIISEILSDAKKDRQSNLSSDSGKELQNDSMMFKAIPTEMLYSRATEKMQPKKNMVTLKSIESHINAKNLSAPTTNLLSTSSPVGKFEGLATPYQQPAEAGPIFEDINQYIKSGVEKTGTVNPNSLSLAPSTKPVSENSNLSATQSNSIILGSPTTFQLPTISSASTAQPLINILTVPVQNVAKKVVQATLKQERTMIRIDPPELGRIQLDFDHSGSGKTIVTLSAETDSVKLMLLERRAFMIGLFEGYGLEDVEVKIDNKFDSDDQASGGHTFPDQNEQPNYIASSEDTESHSNLADDAKTSLTANKLSALHTHENRLHIRV